MAVLQLWVLVALATAGAYGQEENGVDATFDSPPPLYPGDVELFRDAPCPNGLYEDTDRQASPNTKICVEARLNCKIGVTWQSMCNNCTCAESSKKLPSIECTQEDCLGFELPEEDLGNSSLCGDVYDCPEGCGFVRRTSTCVYCLCGPSEPVEPQPQPAEPAERTELQEELLPSAEEDSQ